MAINKTIKFNGAQIENISSIDGVDPDNISRLSGISGAEAGKWIIGAGSGQIWRSTIPDAGYSNATNSENWAKIADLGTSQTKSIAVGEDNSGNKRWVAHRAAGGGEIAYVNDGQEVASPVTSAGNWTTVNLSNDHVAANGGPSIAWGNNTWLGVGDDIGVDDEVLFGSSDGGATWGTVTAGPNINDVGRVVCYKSENTWFFAVQDFIWKCTASPTTGTSWSQVKDLDVSDGVDITSMAYNGSIWLCVDAGGHAWTSDDDWATIDASGPNGAQINASLVPWGVCYCAGDINKWFVVGNSGHIWHSPDGNTWTQATTPGVSHLKSVATDNTTIVAVGTQTGTDPAISSVYVSQDGVTWRNTAQNITAGTAFWSISSDLIGVGMR